MTLLARMALGQGEAGLGEEGGDLAGRTANPAPDSGVLQIECHTIRQRRMAPAARRNWLR